MASTTYDVKQFGAHGDGTTKDTAAIQAALDACAEAGGGTVNVPAGTYLTGTLWLRSHVDLHLESGATFLGSPDREDYNADDAFPENQVFTTENTTGAHLIIGHRLENASISGRGTIDGNSSVFFGPLPDDKVATYRFKNGNYPILDWRPSQMVAFYRCRDVAVRDVSLLNAPYWTLFVMGCDDVHIRGLTVTNPPATANGDGIDIDSSTNVTISDCIIYSGDDSITLRGNPRCLGEDKACENVTVTNCILATPCNAIRVGVGSGVVRNCTLSNIVISEARNGINCVSRYSLRSMPRGVQISSIQFSDFIINAVVPVHLILGEDAETPACIEDVSFSRFRVNGVANIYLGGNPGLPLRRLRFNDWDLCMSAGTDNTGYEEEVPYPWRTHGEHGLDGRPTAPCAVYGRHLEDVTFSDFRLRWGDELGKVWRDGLLLEHVTGVEVRDASLKPARPGEGAAEGAAKGAALHCTHCGDVLVSGCRAEPGTSTYLRVADAAPDARVSLMGNDLTDAAEAWVSNVPVREVT